VPGTSPSNICAACGFQSRMRSGLNCRAAVKRAFGGSSAQSRCSRADNRCGIDRNRIRPSDWFQLSQWRNEQEGLGDRPNRGLRDGWLGLRTRERTKISRLRRATGANIRFSNQLSHRGLARTLFWIAPCHAAGRVASMCRSRPMTSASSRLLSTPQLGLIAKQRVHWQTAASEVLLAAELEGDVNPAEIAMPRNSS
jgi:hypothetical protein